MIAVGPLLLLLALLGARFLRATVFKGETTPLVMELPPYRIPMIKSLLIHMWDRSKIFLKKMGGYILAGSVVVWTLSAFPLNISYSKNYDVEIEQIQTYFQTEIVAAQESDKALLAQKRDVAVAELITEKKAEKAEKSFMGRIGKIIAPIFSPIGIDWRGSVALLTGFVAKEIVVSTMGILYAVDEKDESEALQNFAIRCKYYSLSTVSIPSISNPCLIVLAVRLANNKRLIFVASSTPSLSIGFCS